MADSAESSPVADPFEKLPAEIHDQIGSYLRTGDLRNATLVNKQWFERLVDLLWKSPTISGPWREYSSGLALRYLSKILDPERRQLYANKIQDIDLDLGPSPEREHWFKSLRFPSLRHLKLCPSSDCDATLSLLLQPSIQSLDWGIPDCITAAILDMLKRCSRLRHLSIRHSFDTLEKDSLIQILKGCQSVVLDGGVIIYTDDEGGRKNIFPQILVALLHSEKLDDLATWCKLTGPEEAEFLELFQSRQSKQDHGLRSLTLGGSHSTITAILSTVASSLQQLELCVLGEEDDIYNHLRHLTSLTKFVLKRRDCDLFPREFENLAKLNLERLRVLHLEHSQGWEVGLDWLTDKHFDAWISRFPLLRELRLLLELENVTEKALISLAKNCPDLEICGMGWLQSLQHWRRLDRAPLFHKLRELNFDQIRFEHIVEPANSSRTGENTNELHHHEEVKEFASIITISAPNLQSFGVCDDCFFDSEEALLKGLSDAISVQKGWGKIPRW